ncbi:MAG: sulfurtransferase TusA family protein, partial [Gammaproteobacteria bacterium]|nr:sulfurtransferase TusA family protein [Gammaproteobacteria bacterium]
LRPECLPLAAKLDEFAQALPALKEDQDETRFNALMTALDEWMAQAARACEAFDPQLDLSATLPPVNTPVYVAPVQARAAKAQSAAAASSGGVTATVDLSSYACPVYFMRARIELGKLNDGAVIDFLLETGDAAQQVSESLQKEGHVILHAHPDGALTRVRVQKARAAVHA